MGSRYLDHLIVERKYAEAASLCPKLLRASASAWERCCMNLIFTSSIFWNMFSKIDTSCRWVFHFAHLRQLPVLVPYIPTDNPRLRDTAYEVVYFKLILLSSSFSFSFIIFNLGCILLCYVSRLLLWLWQQIHLFIRNFSRPLNLGLL